MTTRQLTMKEIALLIVLLAVVSFVAGIFALAYAFIGGAFGIVTSSPNTR